MKTTAELVPGDRVRLPGALVRTVAEVTASGYVNRRNEPIFYVMYAEGRTREWGDGNTAVASTAWQIDGKEGSDE